MKLFFRLYAYAIAVFMLAPLVLIVWMSFTPDEFFKLPFNEFSLRWYGQIFEHPGFVDAFFLSVRLAVLSSLIATAFSFLAAYSLVRFVFPGRRILDAFFMSPLLIPAVVFGIAMLQFLNRMGLYNSFTSLVLTHVIVVTPFAIRAIDAALRDVPRELEWAAMNLGASRLRAMWLVTLPMSLRGVAAGFIFAFIMSFDEVTVTIFMTGPAHQTLPIRIYNYLSDQVDPTVAAVSALLILMSLALVLVLDRIGGLKTFTK
ncbi:ABC transporter permease [Oceanibacterium hippocampi]|uniref:Inner membrane ABC transporter permease protein YdcV n=1 Tax=Oceanibacterium hippocampi TaxID=745714 RepID=A0A1Y5TKY1_9PROT|nr:ABC transporter permease [Oceanibacterium hippocampi]SLN64519.1 Inner membrane ABC transporter permease protein YdcV [Oceanibacterium hippocampi]